MKIEPEINKNYLIINPKYKNVFVKNTSITNFFTNLELEQYKFENGDVLIVPIKGEEKRGFVLDIFKEKAFFTKGILIVNSKMSVYNLQDEILKCINWIDNYKYVNGKGL